jgi:hypothetical protein
LVLQRRPLAPFLTFPSSRSRPSLAVNRLVNEKVEAAQERGEEQGHGGQGKRDIPGSNIPATLSDIGVTAKELHDARLFRDAKSNLALSMRP